MAPIPVAELFFAAFVGGMFARSVALPLAIAVLTAIAAQLSLAVPALAALAVGAAGGAACAYTATLPRLLDAVALPEHEEAPRPLVPEVLLGATGLAVLLLPLLAGGPVPTPAPVLALLSGALLLAVGRTVLALDPGGAHYAAHQNAKFVGLAGLLAGLPALLLRWPLGAWLPLHWARLALLLLVLPPLHAAFHTLVTTLGVLPGRLATRGTAGDLTQLLLAAHVTTVFLEFLVAVVVRTRGPSAVEDALGSTQFAAALATVGLFLLLPLASSVAGQRYYRAAVDER